MFSDWYIHNLFQNEKYMHWRTQNIHKILGPNFSLARTSPQRWSASKICRFSQIWQKTRFYIINDTHVLYYYESKETWSFWISLSKSECLLAHLGVHMIMHLRTLKARVSFNARLEWNTCSEPFQFKFILHLKKNHMFDQKTWENWRGKKLFKVF